MPLDYTIVNKTVVVKEKVATKNLPLYVNLLAPPFTGVVQGEDGKPLAGINIVIKGTNRGTTTDDDGKFIIETDKGEVLVLSGIGYEQKEWRVDGENAIFVLKVSVKNLQEVAVVSTGYENIPKERATGSFETISTINLNQRVTADIISRLEGLSSLYFEKNSNRPAFTIRGYSSILGSNEPLIILDNFPFEGDINRINPSDIESVSVLKDASAASIWGTRAANGVIVIKTKHGEYNRKPEVTLNNNVTFSEQPDLFYLPQITTSDYIDFEKDLFSKGFYQGPENNKFSRPALSPVVELLIKQRDGIIGDADAQIDRLRQRSFRESLMDELYRDPILQQHAISVKGGDERVNYYISLGYIGSENEFKAKNNRVTFNSQANYKISKQFNANITVGYIERNTTSGAPVLNALTGIQPYFQLTQDDGTAAISPRLRRPYTDTAGAGKLLDWNYYPLTDYQHSRTSGTGQNIIGGLTLEYTFIPGLIIQGTYNYQRQSDQTNTVYDLQSWYARDLINRFTSIDQATGQVTYPIPVGAISDMGNATSIANNTRAQVNYNKTMENIQLNALAGFELRDVKTRTEAYRNYGYDPNVLTVGRVDYLNSYPTYINGARSFIQQNNFLAEKNSHFVSTFVNASLVVNDKYIISGSGRRDASNLFGVSTNQKWTPLWSSGLAWKLSSENWYQSSLIPDLKLRATYGYAGSVDLRRSSVTALFYAGLNPYNNFARALVSQYPNPDLRWEKTRTINIGVDFSSINNVLSGTLEVYFKKGVDLLGASAIDQTTGVGSTIEKNVANMTGKGIELTLRAHLTNGVINWNTNLIFQYNRSKITDYYLTSEIGNDFVNEGMSIKPVVGNPVYSILSYRWAGLDSQGNPQGMVNDKVSTDYYDLTGAGTRVEDMVFGGSAVPTYFGSLINSLGWKSLSLSVNIMYKFGYNFLKPSVNYSSMSSGTIGNSDYGKRWQAPGDENRTTVPSMVYPFNAARDWFYNNSEVLIRKGDHVRLSYINIGYSLPEKAIKRLGLRQLQFYVNASNLGIIWKANSDDLDPEYLNTFIFLVNHIK
jgi:TonB-linked SusC/RagA family outer membrane protein